MLRKGDRGVCGKVAKGGCRKGARGVCEMKGARGRVLREGDRGV